MDVASLELCKELYELSGWEGSIGLRYLTRFDDEHGVYTLGFLLRKLPREYDDAMLQIRANDKSWSASYTVLGDPYSDVESKADTPENALCALAIELLEQGVLQKEVV